MVEQTLPRVQEQSPSKRISPMDPDFIIVAAFAIIVDALDVIFELLGFLILPKLFGIIFDVATAGIIGGWIYWKTGKMIKVTENKKEASKRLFRRMLKRIGLTFLGELIWILGIVPFWTITVILTLRKK